MESSILPGDIILCSKIHYGFRSFDEFDQYRRNFKFSEPKVGDIVIFNAPFEDSIYNWQKQKKEFVSIENRIPYVKRIVAAPGDFYRLPNQLGKNLDTSSILKIIPNLNPEILSWNKEQHESIVVPRSKDSIYLTLANVQLYKRVISHYENNSLEIENDGIIRVNHFAVNTYNFQMDYFLVHGEKSEVSIDSRYWGFLPENHIIGKAIFVLFSFTDTKDGLAVRWERFLKVL